MVEVERRDLGLGGILDKVAVPAQGLDLAVESAPVADNGAVDGFDVSPLTGMTPGEGRESSPSAIFSSVVGAVLLLKLASRLAAISLLILLCMCLF